MSECFNEHCQCADGGGFCDRHQFKKTSREVQLCKGVANSPDSGRKYWVAWEQGKLGATPPAEPVLNPKGFCNQGDRGLGDRTSAMISAATLGMVQPCGGCKGRAAVLNHLVPGPTPPIDSVEFGDDVRRNLVMHIWPSNNSWRWNCDQLLKRAHLFNGRRIIGIATDARSRPDQVKEYLKDFTDEFIIVPNNPRLREVMTFLPMLERLEQLNGLNEVTFNCHSKGSRHRIEPDNQGSTIYRWTEAMWEVCLDDWAAVATALKSSAMAGAFKRYGQFTTRGNHRWHYSGTFYWFRNADVFARNWRYIDRQFFGTESWPGLMFQRDETACLFMDEVEDLYVLDYWDKTVQPALDRLRHARSVQAT